jgi:hypothetical protein
MPRSFFRGEGQRTPQSDQKEYRYYQPQFYDPMWFVQGSMPEKMVMKELVRRGIYFVHTPQENPVEWGNLKQIAKSDPTKWEADFLFPQHKIWMEVQGAYFHTMPGVPEKEALRFALIEAAGWRPIFWWDYDIEARRPELMDSVPEFYRPPGAPKGQKQWAPRNKGKIWPDGKEAGKKHTIWHSKKDRWGKNSENWGSSSANSHHNYPRRWGEVTPGLPFLEAGEGVDHLKGLRTANSNRATTPQYGSKYRNMDVRRSKIRKRYRHS